jgi:hypothetical protein
MRTTITIDDGLLEDVKRLADEMQTSVSALIEEALRARLAAPPPTEKVEAFRLITYGRGGLLPGYTWEALGSEDDEVERFLALRKP